MKYGSPYAAGYGNPESCFTRFDAERVGGRLRLTVQARSDIPAAWYEVTRNSRHVDYIFLKPAETRTVNVPCEPGFARHALALLRCGYAPATMQRAARWYDGQTSKRASHWWSWLPAVVGSRDAAGLTVLTSWALAGVWYNTTQRVTGKPTRGTIRVAITVAAGAVTLELYRGTTLVASGSGSVGASVTLSGEISGSVSVDAGAVTATETLEIRWPASMLVKRGTSNPPSATVATVPFDAADETTWTEPSDLAGGTYYYRFAPVSDTGDTGADSSTVAITIAAAPAAPSGLAYDSGDESETVLSFVPSTTAGATHRVYLQQPGEESMPETPCAATVDAGAGEITLPAITGPGVARVLVRAVAGGIEERVGASVALEYDALGAYVPARPNAPTIAGVSVTSGRTVAVQGSYPTTGAKGTATTLGIYAKQPGGSYGALLASGSLGAEWNGVKNATVSYSLASNGFWWVKLVARTAAGVESETAAESLVYVSDVDPATVTADGYNSRG